MEVPDFCTKAAPRVTRRRKAAKEKDPDYQPAPSRKSEPTTNTDRKRVRRSKTIETNRKKPPPMLNYIERPEYSIENWKSKASEVRQSRSITKTISEFADNLRDVDSRKLLEIEYPVDRLAAFESKNPYQRYYTDLEEPDGPNEEEKFLDYRQLPLCVMGTGKGLPNGPPEFEFKSLWNYELQPVAPHQSYDSIQLPWHNRDITEPDMSPEILSIVACFTVGRILDLEKIAKKSRNVEFNPDRFAPLIMRIRDPKSTALIFGTGRIIVSGTKSEEECREAARKYTSIISNLGYKVNVLNFDIQNISAACNLKFRVRLNQLSKNLMYGKLSYEPEIFPGLVISLEYPKVKVIVFCTGSVLMTGAKSVKDINLALKAVYPLVRMYAP